jgi:hypothetical protein
VAHLLADEFGLLHVSEGDGAQRHLVVSKPKKGAGPQSYAVVVVVVVVICCYLIVFPCNHVVVSAKANNSCAANWQKKHKRG